MSKEASNTGGVYNDIHRKVFTGKPIDYSDYVTDPTSLERAVGTVQQLRSVGTSVETRLTPLLNLNRARVAGVGSVLAGAVMMFCFNQAVQVGKVEGAPAFECNQSFSMPTQPRDGVSVSREQHSIRSKVVVSKSIPDLKAGALANVYIQPGVTVGRLEACNAFDDTDSSAYVWVGGTLGNLSLKGARSELVVGENGSVKKGKITGDYSITSVPNGRQNALDNVETVGRSTKQMVYSTGTITIPG